VNSIGAVAVGGDLGETVATVAQYDSATTVVAGGYPRKVIAPASNVDAVGGVTGGANIQNEIGGLVRIDWEIDSRGKIRDFSVGHDDVGDAVAATGDARAGSIALELVCPCRSIAMLLAVNVKQLPAAVRFWVTM
jgi:hypothetical protein